MDKILNQCKWIKIVSVYPVKEYIEVDRCDRQCDEGESYCSKCKIYADFVKRISEV